jgi:hypothetical protein
MLNSLRRGPWSRVRRQGNQCCEGQSRSARSAAARREPVNYPVSAGRERFTLPRATPVHSSWLDEVESDAFVDRRDTPRRASTTPVPAEGGPAPHGTPRPPSPADRTPRPPSPADRTPRPPSRADRTPGLPEPRSPADQPAARPPGARRTVTITGRGSERGVRAGSRRPARPARERGRGRPDRVALWAVLLGLTLLIAAATSSHAAVLTHIAHAAGH